MGITTTELRKQAKRTIDGLTGARLRLAADLLSRVGKQTLNQATRELLEIPGFLDSFTRGQRDVRAGRTRRWREVRADV